MTLKSDFNLAFLMALIGSLIFTVLTIPFHFTLMADDYVFLAAARDSNFGLQTFGHFVSRFPVWTLVTYMAFKNFVWENTWILMHLFFFLYAWSVAYLVLWFS